MKVASWPHGECPFHACVDVGRQVSGREYRIVHVSVFVCAYMCQLWYAQLCGSSYWYTPGCIRGSPTVHTKCSFCLSPILAILQTMP